VLEKESKCTDPDGRTYAQYQTALPGILY